MGIVANWAQGVVTEVVSESQAAKFGVQPGWRILRWGGENYGIDLPAKYGALQQPYTVRFASSRTPSEAKDAETEQSSATKREPDAPIVEQQELIVIEVPTKQTMCFWCAA